MLKWLLTYILDRVLIALALYYAYTTWGHPLRQSTGQASGDPTALVFPYEQIRRALE